ncbi:histidinol-phosphate transaminase [Dongshaea marina]|uniref:histidinol-phosphate transaminase n=1 Tax=Dongshaea marina TaxID=2047966 RepID=UPI000D3E5241|nr:histidinol-phosphate transaminase [Dongshaea marina]
MSCDFIQRAHPGVRELHPYQPGKPTSELERELGLSQIVKLASNENPLGCSPRVIEALREAASEVHRYPDANGFELKKALSHHLGCGPEQLILGNGSNEVLELLLRTFVTSDDEVIYSEHAFIVYELVTQSLVARAVKTPAREWGHDLEAMSRAITDKTKVVCIANPNNPTGTLLDSDELYQFIKGVPPHVLILLDEAYGEYLEPSARAPSISWLGEFDNLILCRTFSKAYGLAGLRLGYAVAHPRVADLVNRLREPFNTSLLAQAAAIAALGDSDFIEQSFELNRVQKLRLESFLQELQVDYISSHGNFITLDLGQPAAPFYQALLALGVIVRPIAGYGMPNHLRVTIGTEQENQIFMDALKRVLKLAENDG